MKTARPGDRVLVPSSNMTAKVLEVLADGKLLLDTPDGPLPYSPHACKAIGRTAPRGEPKAVAPEAVEALRLRDAGTSRGDLAARFGVSLKRIDAWLVKARAVGPVP